MSSSRPKRNYSQYYGNYEPKRVISEEKEEVHEVPKTLEPEVIPAEVEVPKVEKVVEKREFKEGKVVGGSNLNVREKPNGNIVNKIPSGKKVVILDSSDADWYKIQDPEGYVMKKFIELV